MFAIQTPFFELVCCDRAKDAGLFAPEPVGNEIIFQAWYQRRDAESSLWLWPEAVTSAA